MVPDLGANSVMRSLLAAGQDTNGLQLVSSSTDVEWVEDETNADDAWSIAQELDDDVLVGEPHEKVRTLNRRERRRLS